MVELKKVPRSAPSVSHPRGWALDLFCGTRSVVDHLKTKGFGVICVDNDPRANADFTVNVLTWDYKKEFSPGAFALIAAGVPCTEYSVAKLLPPEI